MLATLAPLCTVAGGLLRTQAAPACAVALSRAFGALAKRGSPVLPSRKQQQHVSMASVPEASQQANVALWRNPAAVLYGANDLRFEDWGLPERLAPGQVRVEMRSVGICGSDVHYLKHGNIKHFKVEQPMVVGHESAGRVVETGPGVEDLKEGDRVALEPGIPCWSSGIARKGRYNLDPDIRFLATPPHHGSLAQLVDHPAEFCYKLPPDLSYDEGAMAEPLSVAIHAVKRAGVRPGKTVAVLGAGSIGLLTMQCAKAFGADAVAITDIKEFNLDVADELGADVTFMPRPGMSAAHVSEQLRYMMQTRGLDVVIDCVGDEETVQTALGATSCGGKVVMVGMGTNAGGGGGGPMNIDLTPAMLQEVDILGSFRYANTYNLAIRLMESKRVNVMKLVTHRFGFSAEEVRSGFEVAANSPETNAIKCMFDLS